MGRVTLVVSTATLRQRFAENFVKLAEDETTALADAARLKRVAAVLAGAPRSEAPEEPGG